MTAHDIASQRKRVMDAILRIQLIVAQHFDFTVANLKSDRRNATLAHARQVAMALARDVAKASWPEIAIGFEKDSHHTAQHAHKRIQALLPADPSFKREFTLLRLQSEKDVSSLP